jgi:hypothetical protein
MLTLKYGGVVQPLVVGRKGSKKLPSADYFDPITFRGGPVSRANAREFLIKCSNYR